MSKRDDEPPEEVINDPDTFEGEIEAMIKDTLAANPDSSVGASRLQVSDGSDPSTNETSISGNVAVNAAILLDTGDEGKIPDDWTRVFHPNPAGHAVIANLIFWKMSVERAKLLNTQMGPELVPAPETCAFNEGDPTKTPTCSANNVPSVPSQVVDSASNKLDMNAVMFIMRQVICSNQCQVSLELPASDFIMLKCAFRRLQMFQTMYLLCTQVRDQMGNARFRLHYKVTSRRTCTEEQQQRTNSGSNVGMPPKTVSNKFGHYLSI